MNIQKLRKIISLYKIHFTKIHQEEIYKWRAVKCFQDNWNIEAGDFSGMLRNSFARTKNLLASGKYFPLRMLEKNADAYPELLRSIFISLYDEDKDLIERIENFQKTIKINTKDHFPNLQNDYQDLRAIIVYLCLRYPDRYYFYKFDMFKRFTSLIEYPYQPKKGKIENILQYLTLSNILKEEAKKDNDLLVLHHSRLTGEDFIDSSFNILTQDIIYAAVKHIDTAALAEMELPASDRLISTVRSFSTPSELIHLRGSFTNYIENDIENKRIGDLGELLVLEYEQGKIRTLGLEKEVIHISKSKGDGLGYDILSYDPAGNKMFIEVKTTKGDFDAPLYITANELERSKKEDDHFYLYRLYDFDDELNRAKFMALQGDLTSICINPVLYKFQPDKDLVKF